MDFVFNNAILIIVLYVQTLIIVENVIIIIIISNLLIINHVFVLMGSLIIQKNIFANNVLLVAKPVMTKDMINVLLVSLIQIHQSIIN